MASLALANAGSIAELFGVVELVDLTPMPMDSDGLAPIVDLCIYVRRFDAPLIGPAADPGSACRPQAVTAGPAPALPQVHNGACIP